MKGSYSNIILCLKVIFFIFIIKGMKPFKERMVKAKRDICVPSNGICKLT